MLENFELVSSLRAFVILYVLYHSLETLLLSQKFVKIPVFRPLAFSDIIGDVIMCYYTRNKVGPTTDRVKVHNLYFDEYTCYYI